MLLASFLFVSMDSIVKYLVQIYSVPQVAWARYSFHMLFLILFLRGRLPKIMATQRLGIQLFRSLLLFNHDRFVLFCALGCSPSRGQRDHVHRTDHCHRLLGAAAS